MASGPKKPNCPIPDDCIDLQRQGLFMARAVLRELVHDLALAHRPRPGVSS